MPFILDENLKKEIETILFDFLQVILGFSIAIVNEESIIYSRGFGIKEREKQLPAKRRMEMYSLVRKFHLKSPFLIENDKQRKEHSWRIL